MANKNISKAKQQLYTAEGGGARTLTAEQELERLVMSCLLWEEGFYVGGKTVAQNIAELVPKVKPEFCQQLAIKARSEGNLRHVPLLLVREMARTQSHKHLVAETLFEVIQRPDEISEFLSIYWNVKTVETVPAYRYGRRAGKAEVKIEYDKQPISAQVKKGLAAAFTKFNEYSLAKHSGEGRFISLANVMHLVHPKPKDGIKGYNAKVRKFGLANNVKLIFDDSLFYRLMRGKNAVGTLEVPYTWEVELSSAGVNGKTKKQVWEELLEKKALGGLAWLRNLRNMQQEGISKELIAKAAETIDFRRVLPFRYIAAARYVPMFEDLLETILLKQLNGQPMFQGSSIILADVSGSMFHPLSAKSDMQRIDAACGLAIIMRELCRDVRVFTFSQDVLEVPNRRGFALRDVIVKSQSHRNTYLSQAIENVKKKLPCDRLIVLTDEQSHDEKPPNPTPGVKSYLINVGVDKRGVGYHPWIHIDGFSEAVVKFIQALENEL
jgi:60 kDa SS-A/Ro ribonucleoprotein